MDNIKDWAAKLASAGIPAAPAPVAPAPLAPAPAPLAPAPAPTAMAAPGVSTPRAAAKPTSVGKPALGTGAPSADRASTAASRAMKPSASSATPSSTSAKVASHKPKKAPRYSAGGKVGKKMMPMPHANQLKKPAITKQAHIQWAKVLAEKQAGYWSELGGSSLNPVNLPGGNHLGSLAALLTKTRGLPQQAEKRRDAQIDGIDGQEKAASFVATLIAAA